MYTADAEYRLTVAELDAILSEDESVDDRRRDARVDYRNRAQIICLRTDSPTVRSDVSLVWTADVSVTGVKLLLPDSLRADRFWIRFPGNVLRDPFIECRLQWRDEDPAHMSVGSHETLHRCGVQFQRILSREEFEQLLAQGQ